MSSVRNVIGLSGAALEHGFVEAILLVHARKARREHELQLGAEESDRIRSGLTQMRHVDREASVHVQPDFDAVLGDRRDIARAWRIAPDAGPAAAPFQHRRSDVGLRPDMHFAGGAVDDDRIASFDDVDQAGDEPHGGDAERARDNGDVARRPAFLQHEPAQPLGVIVEKRRRPHVARHDDGVFRQLSRSAT